MKVWHLSNGSELLTPASGLELIGGICALYGRFQTDNWISNLKRIVKKVTGRPCAK